MIDVSLTSEEVAILRTALPIIQRIVQGEPAIKAVTELPRKDDGRHLDDEGIRMLYDFFAQGGTPYGASKKFGMYYGSARERYAKWFAEKA